MTRITGMQNKQSTLIWRIKKYKVLLCMLFPAVVFYIMFHYIPMWGAQIAFRDYKILKGITGSEWIGLKNFTTLLSRPSFGNIFTNTIIISFWNLLFGFPAPIIFALALNEIRHTKIKRVFQTVSYLPHFLSWVILTGLFKQILSPTIGPLASIWRIFNADPIYWLGDPEYFRTTLVISNIWKSFGWGSVVYLAAINGVSPEQYEAATIDGANRFQRIIHVTLPGIAPTVTIMLIFAVGNLFTDNFDQVYNLLSSPVMNVGDVLSTWTYRSGIEQNKFSLATAAGLLQNGISFILVIGTNMISKRINEYGIW